MTYQNPNVEFLFVLFNKSSPVINWTQVIGLTPIVKILFQLFLGFDQPQQEPIADANQEPVPIADANQEPEANQDANDQQNVV